MSTEAIRDRQVAIETVRPKSECPACNPGCQTPTPVPILTPEEWLRQYEQAIHDDDVIEAESERAEETCNYAYVDELQANQNELLADLARNAADIIRGTIHNNV